MPLIFFPRRPDRASPARHRRPFHLLDKVRLPGTGAAPATVIAVREPRPGVHQCLTIDADGSEAWYAATVLRPARFDLRVVNGGRHEPGDTFTPANAVRA